ncbi:single-stranded-DNA-specific exonuclease RecJ [Neptunitalea chrysea]|uniref:Single-stranded-DNA-specific exonuclease RecJ n=1 Tax=Neptunitalea chrysea TaxID=1647581 RepID=A0A9W6EVX8_9FLAO|nr:single-stranded-DNA-specific exonuclease RecJ [Neptunitalea chrysea]GLB53511.1 single-stranded-DNA-specific exonuclease RecJ [Neptunitalea chrysea]
MRWTLQPKADVNKVQHIQEALGVSTFVATLLVQRGIETFEEARDFFRPQLSHLHNPYLMKDMEKAVNRVEQAIANGENILVYGDYDVDGTTAVSLMSSYLLSIYPNVATYIPDRYNEGYGVSYLGIDFAYDNDISLIIALDCGIKAVEKVAYANERGIDFVICDHHRPGDTVPNAVAVLDPKQEDCNYPYDELCGCGVGFKLIQALAANRNQTIDDLIPYLDLVATAIAADIVPITGENRVLCYYGLKVINSFPRVGIKALIGELKKKELTVTDVVFIIAPRINAAGRMEHGQHAVNLLTETDAAQAAFFAKDIEEYNANRRSLDEQITQEALAQIIELEEENHSTTVVYNESWHKGVIGIVASRLTETYFRPTLVFTKSGEKLAASARSVPGFDVYNALEACADCIEQFGGHKYAAGLTLLPEKYEAFKAKFEAVVKATIDAKLVTPEIKIDAVLPLEAVTAKFYRILKQFAPFGPMNMTPVFMTEQVTDTGWGKPVGETGDHLRLVLDAPLPNERKSLTAIGFGLGDKYSLITNKRPFSLAYTIDENEWQGAVSLQLRVKDLK